MPFFPASGGGGSAVPLGYDATVGTSGDYASLDGAWADGKRRVLCLAGALGNDAGSGAVACPVDSPLIIAIEGGLDISGNTFTFASSMDYPILIKGTQGPKNRNRLSTADDNGPTLTIGQASGFASHFPTNGDDCYIKVQDLRVDNVSTVSGPKLADRQLMVTGCIWYCPDEEGAGQDFATTNSFVTETTIVGGGSYCDGVSIGEGSHDLDFTGTFTTSPTDRQAIHLGYKVHSVRLGGNAPCLIISYASDIYSSATIEVSSTLINGFADYINLPSGSNVYVSGVRATALSWSGNAGANCRVADCYFSDSFSVPSTSKGLRFSGCSFVSGVTLAGDDTVARDCIAGDFDATGNPYKFTVASGANRTKIIDCFADAATSDSGTGTTEVRSVVF